MATITIVTLIIYLAAMMWVGWLASKRSTGKSEAEFFITGWTTSWVGISFSIAATFAGAGYVVGTIGQFYNAPAAVTGYGLGTAFAPWLLWIIGRRIWPLARRYVYSTFTDFIGDFYQSEKLRVVVSILVVVFFAPYLATNMIGPAIFLSQASGGLIPYWVGAVVFAVVAVIYTLQGGMRAVIWTDVVQTIIIIVGFLILIPVFLIEAGGWNAVWEKIPDKIALYKPGGGSFWIVFSWFWIVGFMQAANPDRAFRLLVAKDIFHIRKGVIASCVLLNLWTLIAFFLGWSLSVLLPGITATDKVIGNAITNYAPYLVPVFMAVVWAAGMSTLDSGMIGLSAMLTKDVYRKNINPNASENQIFTLSKILTLCFGVLATIVALIKPKDLWFWIAAGAAVAEQWLPMIIGGLYWRKATPAGAWVGFIAGVIVAMFFTYVMRSPIPGPGGAALIALTINSILFVLVSLATKPMNAKHIDLYQGIFKKTSN